MELIKPGETYDIFLIDDRSVKGATIMSIDDCFMEVYYKKYSGADILETMVIPLSRIASLKEPETVDCWCLETTFHTNEMGKEEIYRRAMLAVRLSKTDFDLSKSECALFNSYEDAKQALLEIKDADREEMSNDIKYYVAKNGKGLEEV